MKTTSIAAAVFCLLTACSSEESSHTSSACDGGGGLATSTTGAGGVGGHGNTEPAGGFGGGAAPQACPDPLLGYDPAAVPVSGLVPSAADLVGLVGVMLDPFDATTTCETVIVGFATSPAPCEVPSAIEVVTFDVELPVMPNGATLTAVAPLNGQLLFPTETPGIVEARFHLQTSHVAGLYPFVGATVRPNFCPAVMPLCGGAHAMRYRSLPPEGWTTLSADVEGAPGTQGTLYFGLADCVATD